MTTRTPPRSAPLGWLALGCSLTLAGCGSQSQRPLAAVGTSNIAQSLKTRTQSANGAALPDRPLGQGAQFQCSDDGRMPRARVRRLSHREIVNSLNAVIGASALSMTDLSADARIANFDNNANINKVTSQLLPAYRDLAKKVADAVVVSGSKHFSCNPTVALSGTCMDGFLNQFVRTLFRGVLSPQRKQEIADLYATFRPLAGNDADAAKALVQYLVLAPEFLYRTELGSGAAGASRMTPHEIASYLSFALTESTPDATLLAAADAGQLSTEAQLRTQVTRLVQAPQAKSTLVGMVESIFQVHKYETMNKEAKSFPMFNESLRTAFKSEIRSVIGDVVWDGKKGLPALLTADFTYANPDLANLYGVSQSENAFKRVSLPSERRGVLSLAGHLSLMAHEVQHSPIHRGAFILSSLQCRTLGSPPPGAADSKPPEAPNLVTFRQKVEAQTASPACAACHKAINPPGLAFEHFDALGRYRTQDNGQAIDASGSVNVSGAPAPFENAAQFASVLAGTPDVSACSARHAFRFIEGRAESLPLDECRVQKVYEATQAGGASLQEIFLRLLSDPQSYDRTKG